MSKKRKIKVIQLPQSLESKIRTRARKLTIGKCYISKDWDLMREGNVIVTRIHTNGNLTVAFFLVDMALLGLKDAFYDFNVDERYFLEMITREDFEDEPIEIDYDMAHNIIYGAVDYAEEFGFKPHKNFKVAKFILEEEDEIPFIDIEFGADGMPTVICNNEDLKLSEISQLEKIVGLGNFQVINTDDPIDEDDSFFDLVGDLLPGWDDDIEKMGVPQWNSQDWVTYFNKKPEDHSFRATQYFVDMAFLDEYDGEIDAFAEVLGGATYDNFDSELESLEELSEVSNVVSAINDGDNDYISKVLIESQNKFPESFTIGVLAVTYNSEFQSEEKSIRDMEDLHKRFSSNISFLNIYSSWLIDMGLLEKIPELFNNKSTLKEFDPNKDFSRKEVLEFCCAYCNYFMVVGDFWAGEPYYQVLDTLADDNPIYRSIIQNFVLEKMEFLREEVFPNDED